MFSATGVEASPPPDADTAWSADESRAASAVAAPTASAETSDSRPPVPHAVTASTSVTTPRAATICRIAVLLTTNEDPTDMPRGKFPLWGRTGHAGTSRVPTP